jgi:HAD superfamily phosphatase
MPFAASPSALFFDMDGVLVDVSRSYRRAIQETVEHFTGRQITPNTIQRYKNYGGFNDDWELTHAIVTDTAMEVPMSRIVEQFQHLYRGDNWDGFIAEETPLVKETTLRTLAEDAAVMGVVTGRPQEEAEWTLRHFGWKGYFPLVVGREKQGTRRKPDPFPLTHALDILKAVGRPTPPDEALYVGDSVDDMKAARAAGLWAIGFVPPYLNATDHAALLREHGAHLVLPDLNEMPDLVASFGERVAA